MSKLSHLNRRHAIVLALQFPLASTLAEAATPWPAQPVKIIVPFPAGTSTDLLARKLAPALQTQLDQAFIVEPRGGASGQIGAEAFSRSRPDGYTLMLGGTGVMVVNRLMNAQLPYDAETFEKIALVAMTPLVLLSRPDQPFQSLQQLIAYAKANPGKLSYASFGPGTTAHIAGELLKMQAGVDILHVPYKGAGEALPALVGGQVDLYFDGVVTSTPLVKEGRLRALGLTTVRRSTLAPQLTPIAEQGFPGYDIAPWFCLVAPKGTPRQVSAQLEAAVSKLLRDSTFREQLLAIGFEPSNGTAAELTAVMAADTPRIAKVLQQAGLKP